MTEQAQKAERPAPSIEQIKAVFAKANDRQKAIMKFAATVGVLRKAKATDDVIGDAFNVAMKSFALDVEIAMLVHLNETHKETNVPLNIVIGMMGLELCDRSDVENRRLINVLELVREQGKANA
ncbi:hypothetical protein I6F35_33520 [Bradyrhizobium sp. BRP22]|uniref:hypothetical protein n=1 Tax=Bradyrhizobium sp. BRP22 TaxID=2793821 RepID=UPI001CD4E287|nr:hypothetical protein [Bradyrhizobium sp. BRP22]MCA1458055.1 hypothetical protein [Bradyrhizobium sp. BRP22]